MIVKGDHLILGKDETYNPDVQEALSLRHGRAPIHVLPLKSGRLAVLGDFRELHSICDTWEEVLLSAKSIQEVRYTVVPREPTLTRDRTNQQEELEALLGL